MKHKIIKEVIGRWKFYKIVDEKGKLIKEFDDYNYQKPFYQAKQLLKELSKVS